MVEQCEHVRVAVQDSVKGSWFNDLFKPAQVYTAAVIQSGITFNGSGVTVFSNTELCLTCWKDAAFWLS